MDLKILIPFSKNLFLLLVRIAVGFAMLTHGYPKLQTLLEGKNIQFYNFLGLNSTISLGLTVFAEFGCSILLIFGLYTRWASFFLAFTMAIAAFVFHAADTFEKKEMSILYLCVYILLFIFGGGKFSRDAFLENRSVRNTLL